MGKFVLRRKDPILAAGDKDYMTVRIRVVDYNTLVVWANETGEPLVALIHKALNYCKDNLEWSN